ncbi:hypothetical protein C2G38_2228251 [Gigaspora rosea]|uniref:Uncharacterized protein n=1 Tax=Gigaspora rosea TaxID=44941 RepID=A0A397TVY7_9GLOM|nr:hypothetical protein C2G38_2228251 [Gigaspora rosea]
MKNKLIDIIINKSYDNQSDSKEYYKRLPRKKKLDLIRKMLEKNEYDSNNTLHMGSNCFFLLVYSPNNKAEILQNEECNYCISKIIEEKDGKHFLYIRQKIEFDKTMLKDEKGFKFNENSSVVKAYYRAFQINTDSIRRIDRDDYIERSYKCKYEKNEFCKRSLILMEKFRLL